MSALIDTYDMGSEAPTVVTEGGQATMNEWYDAGFAGSEALAWRRDGWSDPSEASRWRVATASTDLAALAQLRDAGYEPDDVMRVADIVGEHVVPWTRVLVDAAPSDVDSHHAREATARFVLDQVAIVESGVPVA